MNALPSVSGAGAHCRQHADQFFDEQQFDSQGKLLEGRMADLVADGYLERDLHRCSASSWRGAAHLLIEPKWRSAPEGV